MTQQPGIPQRPPLSPENNTPPVIRYEGLAEAVAILRAALDSIVLIDDHSHVLEWNRAAEQTFGYSREEAIGQDMAELIIPPDLRPAHHAGLAHYLTTGEGPVLNNRIEIRAMRRGGEQFPVELTVVPVERQPPRFAAYLRDITERKRQEQALQRSEERFRSLIEAMTDIVWVRSPMGTFDAPQPTWSAFTGMEFEQLQGWGWLDAVHPEDRERVRQQWTDAVQSPQLYLIEYRLRRQDGIYRQMRVRSVPLREEAGAVREWIGVSTDVTERRQAEQRLLEQAGQQRRFIREMLTSVTEGKLFLCDSSGDLPEILTVAGDPVPLTDKTVRLLRKQVEEIAAAQRFATERVQDLLTSVGEAGMNAIRHGGGSGTGRVCVDPATHTLQVWIQDHGTGIREEDLHRATLTKGWSGAGSLGYGFFLMLHSIDRIYLLTSAAGTTVVLEMQRVPLEPNALLSGGL